MKTLLTFLVAAVVSLTFVGCGEDSTSRVEYGVQGTASIPMDENTTFTMNTEDPEATAQLTTDGEGNNVLNVSCNDCTITVDYSDNTDNSSAETNTYDNNNTDSTTPQQVIDPTIVNPVVVDPVVINTGASS